MIIVDETNPALGTRLISEYKRALSADPHNTVAKFRLAYTYHKFGLADECLTLLDEARENAFDAQLCFLRSNLLAERGDVRGALNALEEIICQVPNTGEALLARCSYLQLRQDNEALQAYLNQIEVPDRYERVISGVQLRVLSRSGDPERLFNYCEDVLRRFPCHTSAVYYKALALAASGRPELGRASLSLDRFVKIIPVEVPQEYSDMQAFCEEIAAELKNNAGLKFNPLGKATRNGWHTKNPRDSNFLAIERLIVEIQKAVLNYISQLRDQDIPLVASCPSQATLDIWAGILHENGQQVSHHHPGGWLSGVFYVKSSCSANSRKDLGPLILGGLVPEGSTEMGEGIVIDPVPGRLVIFPSYTPHGTLSVIADGERIAIAFDVIARSGNNRWSTAM